MAVARDLAVGEALSGEGFLYMRKAIGMRSADLAALLDVLPETLVR